MRSVWGAAVLVSSGFLLTADAQAQDCTGIIRGVKEMPDSVHVAWDPAAMPPAGSAGRLDDAMNMWNGSCAPGNIPAFSSASSSVNVTVSYVSGNSFTDACGSFNISTNRVTVYSYARVNGQDISCAPTQGTLTDNLAHELGHFLGLSDECKGVIAGDCPCRNYVMAQSAGYDRSIQSDECLMTDTLNHLPAEPEPPPPPPIKNCPVYTPNCNSPIVLNFGLLPYELTDSAHGVQFDIDGDGVKDQIGWTAAGRPLAFLWLDRDSNGTVTDGRELFGNHTLLKDGREATNGFEALAEFDSNGDGVISDADPVWWELMLWTDLNHDGVSQENEIRPLALSSASAIGVDSVLSLRRDRFGNLFRYRSTLWVDGQAISQRPVYDIFFVGPPAAPQPTLDGPVRE